MTAPIILHIDFDSFFASVEQQDNPTLRGKPIGVTASNGRTAIISASREAKSFGIKNVTRTFEAYEICPSLLAVPAHFTRYLEVSKKFLHICNLFSPVVEVFSIDEVFMDVTATAILFGGVDNLITLLKQKILKEIGPYITVSVGVSHNKMLAKVASGMRKPNGVFTITHQNLADVYAKAKLTDICGIGSKIAERLHKIGVYSLSTLTVTSLERLVVEFGVVEGRFLHQVGLGVDSNPIVPYTTSQGVKSVGRNYCLPHNEYNKRVVYQNVFELCEEVAIKLRRLKQKAQVVGLGIRGDTSYYSRKKVTQYIDTGPELFLVCKQFLSLWQPHMVRMISVYAADLVRSNQTPAFLFEQTAKKASLQKTIDMLNTKFGDHTIRNGFLLYSEKLTTVPNGYFADTYERQQLIEFT